MPFVTRRSTARIWSAGVLGLLVSMPFARAVDAPSPNEDGLVQAPVEGVDRVLQRPGTDWAAYTKVLVAPVEVSLSICTSMHPTPWTPAAAAPSSSTPAR